jgi:succinate dehydrogenase / fumarate reductase, cytochrome b subunit
VSHIATLSGQLGMHTSLARRRAWSSTITLKLVMAISGLLFIAFVLGHAYGNLKAFSGHDAYNEYAEHLRTLGEPIFPRSGLLWIMRVGLIAALVAHVSSAIVLARRARRAAGRYAARPPRRASSFASRTMLTGGLTLFLFLGWHLVNFTIGKVNVRGGPTNDPFNLVVDTFSVWWSTAIYLAAMLVLGMHLWHGTWSSLQTLGWTLTAKRRQAAKAAAMTVAVVVAGGFSLSPIAIQLGLIGP